MPYAPTTWVDGVTKLGPTNLNKLEQGLQAAAAVADLAQPRVTRGTTPPVSPNDGDEWILPADATAGVLWRFRYNAASASAYKWEFIGGCEAEVFSSAAVQPPANTLLLSLAVPRAGDYTASGSSEGYHPSAVVSGQLGVGGGGGCTYPLSFSWESPGIGQSGPVPRERINGLAASAAVSLWLLSLTQSGSTWFRWRWLTVRPVRVS